MADDRLTLFCPACARESEHRVLLTAKARDHALYACAACQLRRFFPIPESYIMQGMYEQIAQAYDGSKAEYSLRSAEFYLKEIKRLTGMEGRRLLDIGCGLGYYSNAFGKLGLEVTVIEPDRVSHEFCEKHQSRISRIVKIPIEDYLRTAKDRFDIVYCRHVIEHLRHPLDTLKGLKDVCHPKTVAVVETDNNDSTELLEHPEAKQYWGDYYLTHYDVASLEEVKALRVTALGFKNSHYYAYNRENLSRLFGNLGFTVFAALDYHLGDRYLWPNIPDYSSAKVYLRRPRYLRYLGDVLKYRRRIKKIPGAGILAFLRPG